MSRWTQFVLSTPVVLWCGWPFFERGWQSILNRSLNMFTLIAIGVGAAYFYSAVVMLLPQIFPPSFAAHGKIGIYFEAAAVITVLGVARASAGTARAQSHRQRNPRVARVGAKYCAHHSQWRRERRSTR